MTVPTNGSTNGGPTNAGPTNGEHYHLHHLADLAEDLMSDADATAAHAHLDSCAACRAEYAAVREVGPLLRAAATVAMPLDVARRLEATLTHEVALRAAPETVGAPTANAEPVTGADDVRSLTDSRRRRTHRIRRIATALVGVAAVFGGAFVFGQNVDWLGGADAGLSAGGVDSSARDESAPATPEAAAEEGPGAGELDAGEDGAVEPPATLIAGEYTAAGLTDEVTSLLVDQSAPRLPGTEAPIERDGTATDGVPDRTLAAGCVAAVAAETGIDREPLAVDVSSYEGNSAVVVVVPPPRGDTGVAQIWVVGDGCLTATGTTELEVLERATLAVVAPRD